MNSKQLAELLRGAADRLDTGTWSDGDHLELIEAAQASSEYELTGNLPKQHLMTRERWNQLSPRDRGQFFKNGGQLIDAPKPKGGDPK
ncbi:MAG: hypothetical protein SF339_18330 [Blastocatellia bacterium]|nr:hypothetical protein [Blastocatellia bacterium]